MDSETARLVLFLIATVGAVVWLISLQFLLITFRKDRALQPQAADALEMSEPPPNCIVGSSDGEGERAELASKAAALLAKGTLPFGPMKILERSDQRVLFENVTTSMQQQPGSLLQQGQVRFTAAGQGRTRIDYVLQLKSRSVFLWMAIVFQTLGLAALIGLFLLLNFLVVEHPVAGVRFQVIQMMQAVHLLWPPFLVVGLYRRGRRLVKNGFEVFINNLPYHSAE